MNETTFDYLIKRNIFCVFAFSISIFAKAIDALSDSRETCAHGGTFHPRTAHEPRLSTRDMAGMLKTEEDVANYLTLVALWADF
jgi:hypothetical protein